MAPAARREASLGGRRLWSAGALALLVGCLGGATATGCDRGQGSGAPPSEGPSLDQALADAHARAPKPASSLEDQARALVSNLRLARRQMVQTTEGEAERLPAEVVKLSHLGREVIPFLEAALRDPQADTRYFAMQVLEEVGDRRELDRYIAGLADQDAGVARIASEAIGRHRDADTVPILFQALEEGRVRQIRWGNVLKPPKEFDIDHVPYLVRRLADERAEIRMSAFIALGQITGRDLGYDPNSDEVERKRAVMRWENWWSDRDRSQAPVHAPPTPHPQDARTRA